MVHDKLRACTMLENTCSCVKHVTFDAYTYKCTVVFWHMMVNRAFMLKLLLDGENDRARLESKLLLYLFLWVGV